MTDIGVLFLTKYSRKGASSRYRSLQYFPLLEEKNISCTHKPLFSDEYLRELYETGNKNLLHVFQSYLRRIFDLFQVRSYDVVVIEKELFPYSPLIVERLFSRFGIPYIADYDDAIFHNYDQSENPFVRYLLGDKIDGVMKNATAVIAGNNYLAERARKAGASSVETIPTVVNLDRYPDRRPEQTDGSPTIGWIGSPSTAEYLRKIAPALREVCDERDVHVKLIGSGDIDLPGVNYEVCKWSEETEIEDLCDIDVGIMPLKDNPWERGKCGFKLIQYMGCWKPVVASPIGVNQKIVDNGINGYLADNHEKWVESLLAVLDDERKRKEMGKQGRRRVEQKYCLDVAATTLECILRRAAKEN